MTKIKLVVVDNEILGYIQPGNPDTVNILVARGRSSNFGSMLLTGKYVRLASEKDFNSFHISFDGYREDPNYEFAACDKMTTQQLSTQFTGKNIGKIVPVIEKLTGTKVQIVACGLLYLFQGDIKLDGAEIREISFWDMNGISSPLKFIHQKVN